MVSYSVRDHVDNFFLSVDPRGGLLKIRSLIAQETARDPESARQTFQKIRAWAERELIDAKTEDLTQQLRKRGSPRSSRETLLAIGYLGALEVLKAGAIVGRPLERIKQRLGRIPETLERLTPELCERY